MKKRRVLLLLSLLCLICGYLGADGTGAWFVSGGTMGDAEYQTAAVKYYPCLLYTSRCV